MPCFRRTASCAENRHAPMLREVGQGWVGGRTVFAQAGGATCELRKEQGGVLRAMEADLALLCKRLLAGVAVTAPGRS